MDVTEHKRAHALQLANRRRRGSKLAFFAHWAKIVVVSSWVRPASVPSRTRLYGKLAATLERV